MKPPFTYFGGKTAVAGQIAALLPAHKHYVEPFAGSLAVLLAKPPSVIETVNDLDQRLMAFWRMLRNRPAELQHACALTPHSRAEYLAAYEPAEDELEQARRTWVILTQGRSSHLYPRGGGWRHEENPQGAPKLVPASLDAFVRRMGPAVERIRHVSLECQPALEVITRYGRHPGCLIYADPPYMKDTRTWANGAGYGHEMLCEDEHRELLEALLSCHAAVVLSGYASPLYDDLLGAWSRREIATKTGNGGSDQARIEVLWSNRPFPYEQADLFGDMERQCEQHGDDWYAAAPAG